MSVLIGYDTGTSSMTFICREERFPSSSGGHTHDHVPDPIVNSADFNRYLCFTSSYPGYVNVDWGDGTKEQFPFVKQKGGATYYVMFRSLDIEWKKNSDATTWWFTKEDGSQYIPNPCHVYADDSEKAITMTFTNKVDGKFQAEGIVLYEWPIMDLPDIAELGLVRAALKSGTIDADRIGRSVNIRSLNMGAFAHPGKWSDWPAGFLALKDLEWFYCNSVFDFADNPDSNWREMSVWTKLIGFNFNWNNVPKYVPYFNEIPGTEIQIISTHVDIPTFEEVDKIADDKTKFNFLGQSSSWKDDLVRGKLNKIQSTYVTSGTIPLDALPGWFYEVREFRLLSAAENKGAFTGTQERADTFANTMYEATTGWEQSTMSQTAKDGQRNQFYGLELVLYTAVDPGSVRPSGTYQAPEGFVKGQSNGNPQTPMEKIYVLVNNYAQVWTLAPETKAAVSRSAGRIEPYVLCVRGGEGHIMSGDILGEMDARYGVACKEEALEICERYGYDSSSVIEYFNRIERGETYEAV